ncbi:MAG: 30S ribosomal protein S16 [Candidatus Paceibacterota bacterium]
MLKIRLKRVGRKHDPSFRLVVLESRRGPKSGDYIENLGSYNARTDEKNVNGERVTHWITMGAKPSDTAHNLLVELGVITGKKVNVLPKKSPIVKEGSEEVEAKAVPQTKEEEVKEEKAPPEEVPEVAPEEITEDAPKKTASEDGSVEVEK